MVAQCHDLKATELYTLAKTVNFMLCEFCHNKECFTNVIHVCHSASIMLTQSLPDTNTFWRNSHRWGDMPERLLVQVLGKQLFWFCEVSWDGYLGWGWLQKLGFITKYPAISLCSEFNEAWKSGSTLSSICGRQRCRLTILFRAVVIVVQSLSHVQFFATPWLQHARLPCPSLSLGVCSNSCPLRQWSHQTISSSVASFSSCPQSFPASGSFPKSLLFASDGQIIGVSASVFPMHIQGPEISHEVKRGCTRLVMSSKTRTWSAYADLSF